MEIILIWALTYAIVRAGRRTAQHAAAAVRGRPRPPRLGPSTPVAAAAGVAQAGAAGAGRAAGTIWQSAADGWRAGWQTGRTARTTGAGFRPWRQPWNQPGTPTSGPNRPGPDGAGRGGTLDAEDANPRCWSDLTGDQQRQVVTEARARFGRDWADLTLQQAAAAVRALINRVYETRLTVKDVLAAQRNHDDPTWRTGPPPAGAGDTDAPTPASDDSDVIDAEIVAPRSWVDLLVGQQEQVIAAAEATYGRPWDQLTNDERAAATAGWISTAYRVDRTTAEVLSAPLFDHSWRTGRLCAACNVAARDHVTPNPDPAQHAADCPLRHQAQAASADPAQTAPDSGPALAVGPAHDPAANPAGTTHEGAAPMSTGSGETTTISATRAYYTQLATHAESDIASRIELSRTYMTAAQLSDPGVLAAIAHAHEQANLLAAAARGVPAALEAHRLMEEAVKSTPGAAKKEFYED